LSERRAPLSAPPATRPPARPQMRQRAAADQEREQRQDEAAEARARGELAPDVRQAYLQPPGGRCLGGEVDTEVSSPTERADLEAQIEATQARLAELREEQASAGGSGAGKTDDALLIVMRARGGAVCLFISLAGRLRGWHPMHPALSSGHWAHSDECCCCRSNAVSCRSEWGAGSRSGGAGDRRDGAVIGLTQTDSHRKCTTQSEMCACDARVCMTQREVLNVATYHAFVIGPHEAITLPALGGTQDAGLTSSPRPKAFTNVQPVG
jgi:hypothetical protein